MKIAISSQNARTVTGHPGKCRKFWIYSVEEGRRGERVLLELEAEQMFHQHPGDQSHPLDEVDVLISGMMALWLQERMAAHGVRALATSETDPDRTVDLFLAGTLPELPVHGGHDHDHAGHGHGHGHGNYGGKAIPVGAIPIAAARPASDGT